MILCVFTCTKVTRFLWSFLILFIHTRNQFYLTGQGFHSEISAGESDVLALYVLHMCDKDLRYKSFTLTSMFVLLSKLINSKL